MAKYCTIVLSLSTQEGNERWHLPALSGTLNVLFHARLRQSDQHGSESALIRSRAKDCAPMHTEESAEHCHPGALNGPSLAYVFTSALAVAASASYQS
jgi:hypothetical protein